jgi:hypothetical protein
VSLDARWADRFEGLSVTHKSDGATILYGPVADQAAPHGLLRRVRNVGRPVVSVIRVEPAQAEVADVRP